MRRSLAVILALGPETAEEEAVAEAHIAECCRRIRARWSEQDEASRAGRMRRRPGPPGIRVIPTRGYLDPNVAEYLAREANR